MIASLAEGKTTAVRPEATPISKSAEQRAGQRADTADDDGDEARHQQAVAHGRLKPDLAGGEHAGQSGKKDADREIERAQRPHIDAERGDGLEVERAGADAHADPGIAQQHEQHGDHDRDHRHHEHAIAGDEEELGAQRRRQRLGTENGSPLAPQIWRVPSSMMKARPKVSSRL